MVELRVDYLEELSGDVVGELVRLAHEAGLPAIVTCRDSREGGAKDHPKDLRGSILAAALDSGAAFVDCEYANYRDETLRSRLNAALEDNPKSRLILSAHDFDGKFGNIKQLYADMAAARPGAIVKMVYTARHIADCFEAFDLLHEADDDLIALCMDQAGLASRITAKKLGSFVTFASIDDSAATAPGQLTVKALKELYRYGNICTETQLFGVIADPVAHSMSPAIHNAAFADKSYDGLYLPLLVQGGDAGFCEFMDGVLARPWLGFRGFSVTIPHKGIALEYVRSAGGSIEPLTEKIGAANTIIIEEDGGLAAYNTDYAAALDAITDTLDTTRSGLSGLKVAVIGAGGVSRAIVAGLADAGAAVRIYNRTVEKAEKLAGEFGCDWAGLDDLPNMDAELIVNCTSIGMHPNVDNSPVPLECLREDMAVFDTVYNPPETLLLKQAKSTGARTVDGVAMFVNQAMAQFKMFTGMQADAEIMRRVVMERLVS